MVSTALKIHTLPCPPAPDRTRYLPLSITNSYTATATSTTKRPHTPPSSVSFYTTATESFYEVLGIPIGATCQEIKTAYRKLARTCHPDVADGRTAADEFMRIHAAYSTLSDPEKRAVYDWKMLSRRRTRPLTSAAVRGGGYRGRSWETDQCW